MVGGGGVGGESGERVWGGEEGVRGVGRGGGVGGESGERVWGGEEGVRGCW